MALLNDILNWTETLPSWQRDASRRLLQNEAGLSDVDYLELYSLLKKENEIKTGDELTADPLASEHLPSTLAAGETITLVALRELENVNQIPNDHALTFSESGMTVIFGGNGSGKSGYARVMKRACRARDQSEPVLPNANNPAAADKIPTAKFDVKVAGVSEEIVWSRDSISPDRLSAISVFDSRCARSYLTAEQDVAYLPYGLDIVENLANQVLPKLTDMLESEIVGIDVDALAFDHLLGDTEVGKVIRDLNTESDVDAIEILGTLSDKDLSRATELEQALKVADPLSKATVHKRSALRLKVYADKLAKTLLWVSPKSVKKLQQISEERKDAIAAEIRAADGLRADEELLPGTGDHAWKLLFEAARRYSTEVGYQGEEFPPTATGKVCPLCQEELQEAGTERLIRFDAYIKNDVAKTADAALKKVVNAKEKIEGADLQIAAEEALCDELNEMDSGLLQWIEEFQTCIDSRRYSMLQCLETAKWTEVPELIKSPRKRVRRLAAQQLKAFRTLNRAADQENRNELTKEFSELSARRNLAKSLKAVLELLQRMKKRASLEKCRQSLKTGPISSKSKKFAAAAVTDKLKKALDQEFEELGIGHIKTKLKPRGIKGKMHHRLLLDVPTTNNIDEILSEGEQRAIALASFLAELAQANHSSGIVFDDPVSSLDHWRRRNVARRLVIEAKTRQVVVFTHDTSFLGQLCDEIDSAEIPNSKSFLEWQGNSPGCVNEGLPWDHQGYKARINDLEQAQRKLAKEWTVYPSEKESDQLRHEYDRFRATLERVIQDVVFNGVVKRYRDWIRVDSLEDVVGFDRAEYEAIEKLHKKSCDVVTAHDPSSAKAATLPTATELGSDIAALTAVVERIKSRRKMAKAAP